MNYYGIHTKHENFECVNRHNKDAGLLDGLTAAELCGVVKLMRHQKEYGMNEMYKELTSK